MTYNSCLLGVPIFRDLDEQDLESITALIEPVILEKGDFLFQSGDMLHHLYILHQGALKVYDIAESGRANVLRLLGAGEFIGEHALLEQTETHFWVEALAHSHVCMISGPEFTKLLSDSPKLALKIIQALLNRLEQADNRNTAATTLTARERVVQALIGLDTRADVITLHVSKRDFANSLGMAQETFSRQLRQLSEEGYIQLIGQREIKILRDLTF